ncbi:hypothetical protein fHeYen901_70 [Yersinia phage fHe-Yen9-01]|uniref:Uncharacterized protein n=1 Tax=Yersinia phage fHe-Yen9-01 TaxID=1965363 RepID=A0A1V0DXG2_9CAUD|nr:hypothetical protein KNT60_gp069 [Yersinia phage fHe-Yen9-01]ARB05843.1 hypothetical protein fHeYen901_70 [Yersinia phage fHe-Yen9-01]
MIQPKMNEPDTVINEERIQEIIDQAQTEVEIQAKAKANKFLKKNKREIARLQQVAYDSVLDNNFAAYSYSLKKLRDFYKQPYNDELIATQWATTRKSVWDLINVNTNKI